MPERKERRDAAEHRRIILHTAGRLFAEHGVDKVSMHQIARTADVGQGTLYRRYASKGDLCMDLMQESCLSLRDEMERDLARYADRPARDRLMMVIERWIDYIEEKWPLFGAVQAPPCEDGVSALFDSPLYVGIHDMLRKLFEEGAKESSNRTLDPVYAADSMLAATAPGLYMYIRRGRGYSKEQLVRSIRSVYVDALLGAGSNGAGE